MKIHTNMFRCLPIYTHFVVSFYHIIIYRSQPYILAYAAKRKVLFVDTCTHKIGNDDISKIDIEIWDGQHSTGFDKSISNIISRFSYKSRPHYFLRVYVGVDMIQWEVWSCVCSADLSVLFVLISTFWYYCYFSFLHILVQESVTTKLAVCRHVMLRIVELHTNGACINGKIWIQ